MRKTVIGILALLCLSTAAFAQKADFRRGNRAFRKENYGQADIDYRKGLLDGRVVALEGIVRDIQPPPPEVGDDATDVLLLMDGYTATRAIRSLENRKLAEVPILAMTANAFQEDVQASMDAGMQGHIAKPIDVSNLMDTLSSVLKTDAEA